MRFRTSVELGGRTATGFEVPADVVAVLGKGRKPRVVVTVGGHTYRSTVAVRDGRYLLPLSAGNRAAAGVAAGDEIEVTLEPDSEPREVALPVDLAAILAEQPALRARVEALAYTYRREYVRAIEDAKRPETRQRRVEKLLADLRA